MSWRVGRLFRTQPAPAVIERGSERTSEQNQDPAQVDPRVVQNLTAPRGGGIAAAELRPGLEPIRELIGRANALFSTLVDIKDVEAETNELEEQAFEVLEVLTPKKLGQAEAAFDTWFSGVEGRALAGERLDAMEHLTLIHLLKEGLFDKQPELQRYTPRMEAALETSHRTLTKKSRPAKEILKRRMPRWYLRKQSKDARKIHNAIFASRDESLISTLKDVVANRIPGLEHAVVAVGLLAMGLTGSGAELLAGALHGYLIATLLEHAIHKYAGHASPKSIERVGKILGRFGPIGHAIRDELEAVAFSHGTIHHASYAGSYVDRFAPRDTDQPQEEIERWREKKKDKIEKMIARRDPSEAEHIYRSDYGRKLSDSVGNALKSVPAAALVTLMTGLIANSLGADVGALFGVASILTALIFIPASNYVHPYLHMTREEAFEKATPAMRLLLKSGYVSHIAQAHYLHHRDVRVNQNLVPGADYALGYAPTPVDAIVALRKMKTFY